MPDITMCQGRDCPMKESCYRFTATPDPMQSYFIIPPCAKKDTLANVYSDCDFYLDNSKKQPKVIMTKLKLNNKFQVVYDGYGDVIFTGDMLRYYPMTSTQPDETHACLILLKETINKNYKNFNLKFRGKTHHQLRQNTPPNPWETMWVLFNYQGLGDEIESGNYFVHKTNGVELGSFIEMEQTYYVTSEKSPCSIFQTYEYEIIKAGPIYTVKINGKTVIKFPTATSKKQPLDQIGSIGFYCEDADIYISGIKFKGEL